MEWRKGGGATGKPMLLPKSTVAALSYRLDEAERGVEFLLHESDVTRGD
jgi:hypothetical protein